MNQADRFSNINFNRPRVPSRFIPVFIAGVIFILIWRLVNPNTVFWIGLMMTIILVWIASYGWRTALMALIDFLHFLGTR